MSFIDHRKRRFLPAIPPTSGAGYQIGKSLRLNDNDLANLTWTPGSTLGTRRQLTVSFWMKRNDCAQNLPMCILQAGTGSSASDWIAGFTNVGDADRLWVFLNNGTYQIVTSKRYRDPSAWTHFTIVIDTPNATANDRIRLYENGVRVTLLDTNTQPPQNYDLVYFLTNVLHRWGMHFSNTYPADMYLAECHIVAGQALSPTDFGYFDPITNEWRAKAYAGSYGSHSSYLTFADDSNNTAATLGKDYSGQGNNWTPNNIIVTPNLGNDAVRDTPTDNYCTLSHINKHPHANSSLRDGALNFIGLSATYHFYALGTQAVMEGEKKVFELNAGDDPSYRHYSGIGVVSATFGGPYSADESSTSAQIFSYVMDGTKRNNGSTSAFGASYTTNDIILCYVDATDINNVKIWFSKNGTIQGGGDPVAGTSPAFSGIKGPVLPCITAVSNAASGGHFVNFGQKNWSYTPLTGYTGISSKNAKTPAIKNPRTRIDDYQRTGTGAAASKTGLLFQPDLIWTIPRSGTVVVPVTTSNRGVGKYKASSGTAAEVTDAQAVTAFNSDGFSVGNSAAVNTNAVNYLEWVMKADAANGIEIITWTGDGNATKAIAHNLGVKPDMIIAAALTATGPYYLWHRAFASDTHFQVGGGASIADAGNTNSPLSALSASTITVTNNATNNLNANGVVYIAFVFRNGPLFMSGQYTGNGITDGPVMHCGFKPIVAAHYNSNLTAWVMNQAGHPGNYNGSQVNYWYYWLCSTYTADTIGSSSYGSYDFLSTGMKIRASSVNINQSGSTKYWFAFADQAGKYAKAG